MVLYLGVGIYFYHFQVYFGKLRASSAYSDEKRNGLTSAAFNVADILVRPIYHRVTDRVKAHIFLCMLTYYVAWHMRRALSSLMYAEDDLPAARADRDPVAKASPTSESKRKNRTGLSKDGFPLHDWRGIIAVLGTISRATISVDGVPIVMDGHGADRPSAANLRTSVGKGNLLGQAAFPVSGADFLTLQTRKPA